MNGRKKRLPYEWVQATINVRGVGGKEKRLARGKEAGGERKQPDIYGCARALVQYNEEQFWGRELRMEKRELEEA